MIDGEFNIFPFGQAWWFYWGTQVLVELGDKILVFTESLGQVIWNLLDGLDL